MDKLNGNVLNAMHTLASAMVFKPVEETSLCVDYNKEQIEFEFGSNKMFVNCSMDSQQGAIKDFARQLIMQIHL